MAVNVGESLRQIVGDEAVLDRAEEMDGYLHDWFQRFTGKAHAVVLPNTTEQVAAIMKFAADHKIVVVPQGGNTGMMGAATPDDNGNTIMLSLRRMNKIREIDQTNMSMTVEAGCILQDLQNAAEAENLYFPLNLAAKGSCTIGGNLGTNAGGLNVVRYGNTRQLTLGLEVVLMGGKVLNMLSGLRKDNTGYDLRDLFIGAEGTLGVITAATMKLFPCRLRAARHLPKCVMWPLRLSCCIVCRRHQAAVLRHLSLSPQIFCMCCLNISPTFNNHWQPGAP